MLSSVTKTAARMAFISCALLSFASYGVEGEPPAAEKIRTQLKARYPKVAIKQVALSPLPGLYELVTEAGLVYTDANGDYLVVGKLVDTKTQEDLTELRMSQLNGVPFDTLPLDLAIKYVKGNGKRRLAVFEDPHCPYCRQIEVTLKDITDTTIYVFLYPIESLHPNATETSRNVWCAEDRQTAWLKVMLEKTAPPAKKCDVAALQLIQKFGDQLGINGTPTLIFADGRRVASALPRDRLEKLMDDAEASIKH
jgi:thiol:disulfide interchange protein DsbC